MATVDFSQKRILVLGDIFLDEYQFGECTRISQEAPVPIVQIDHTKTKQVLGGAGNVIANIRSLGAQGHIGAQLGADASGNTICKLLAKQGISATMAFPIAHRTIVKTRIIAQNQQVVRLDQEGGVLHGAIELAQILRRIPECDAVILSDYAKGYFTRKNVEGIITEAKRLNKLVVVDTKPCNAHWFEGADWLTPNYKEYCAMDSYPSENILITKGAEGMECQHGASVFHVSAIRHEVVDVAGAGDTVTAAFTLALVAKMSVKEAVNFANKAAGVVVAKQGTSTVTVKEIESLEAEIHGLRI